MCAQVRSGDAEVGITDARHAPDGLVMAPFRGQQLVIVFPPDSSRPGGPLRSADLADVPLVVTPPGSSAHGLLDAALSQADIRPVIAIETSQREAVLPLVLAGAGAAVMPEVLAALAAAHGAIPVAFDPPLTRELVIVRRPGSPTPPAAAFLSIAASLAARPQGPRTTELDA